MQQEKLTKLIEAHQDCVHDVRNYIGASSIGSDCYRQIWYEFKGKPSTPAEPKLKRTWEIGKRLEAMVLDLLDGAGIKIVRNSHFQDSDIPVFQGTTDGIWMINDEGEKAIIEIKTAKDDSFKRFLKHGLLKWSKRYYAQIQTYMGMSGIKHGYMLVLNKDTSELHDVYVAFDESYYKTLKEKAQIIYDAVIEPPRVNGSPLWYQCRTCKFTEVCHREQ